MTMALHELTLFALEATRSFGERVSHALGIPLAEHEERDFEDGEHKARPLANVRDRDVFVIQSLYGDAEQSVNDKLCRLLFFLGALRDAAAGRLTAVVPYLCYARKDRKTKPRDPVTTRYVARLFEAVGVDRIVTMDVHNLVAYQNAFQCRTDHLEARKLFIGRLVPRLTGEEPVIVSPDAGGVKRAEKFRESLSRALGRPVAGAFLEKFRSEGVVRGEAVVGDVRGRAAIVVDDLISSGKTLARAAAACRAQGAARTFVAATHGAFTEKAAEVLAEPALEQVLLTDTIPPFRLPPRLLQQKVEIVESAPLFAEAIRRIHAAGSLVDLLE